MNDPDPGISDRRGVDVRRAEKSLIMPRYTGAQPTRPR